MCRFNSTFKAAGNAALLTLASGLAASQGVPPAKPPQGLTSMPAQADLVQLVCSYAPSQSEVVRWATQTLRGAGAANQVILAAAGLQIVKHSSGSYIFKAAGRYLPGTIGTVAPTLFTVVAVIGTVSITVELLCAPINHPALVKKIDEAASAFIARSKVAVAAQGQRAAEATGEFAAEVLDASSNALTTAYRKSITVTDAIQKATTARVQALPGLPNR